MNKIDQLLKGFADIYNKTVYLNKFKMEAALNECTPTEVHFIEYIEKNSDSNVTKLADAFYMTRGAISKLSKKLMKKGYIESYSKADNKKEIYFKLTDKGMAIYKIHEGLHEEFLKRDEPVFQQITEEQLDSILTFVENYNKHLDNEIIIVDKETKM
jgi:Transcriptional regulators